VRAESAQKDGERGETLLAVDNLRMGIAFCLHQHDTPEKVRVGVVK